MKNSLAFVAANRRFLAFGFALAFFSSFGQTFFLSLFAGEIRAEFGLTHGTWGLVYSLATLASGLTIARIFAGNDIASITVARVEVPCCAGLTKIVRRALEQAGQADRKIIEQIVSIDGRIEE